MLGLTTIWPPVDIRAFSFTKKKNAVAAMELLEKEAKVEGCIICPPVTDGIVGQRAGGMGGLFWKSSAG